MLTAILRGWNDVQSFFSKLCVFIEACTFEANIGNKTNLTLKWLCQIDMVHTYKCQIHKKMGLGFCPEWFFDNILDVFFSDYGKLAHCRLNAWILQKNKYC